MPFSHSNCRISAIKCCSDPQRYHRPPHNFRLGTRRTFVLHILTGLHGVNWENYMRSTQSLVDLQWLILKKRCVSAMIKQRFNESKMIDRLLQPLVSGSYPSHWSEKLGTISSHGRFKDSVDSCWWVLLFLSNARFSCIFCSTNHQSSPNPIIPSLVEKFPHLQGNFVTF